jgi:hypothetical protein
MGQIEPRLGRLGVRFTHLDEDVLGVERAACIAGACTADEIERGSDS